MSLLIPSWPSRVLGTGRGVDYCGLQCRAKMHSGDKLTTCYLLSLNDTWEAKYTGDGAAGRTNTPVSPEPGSFSTRHRVIVYLAVCPQMLSPRVLLTVPCASRLADDVSSWALPPQLASLSLLGGHGQLPPYPKVTPQSPGFCPGNNSFLCHFSFRRNDNAHWC